VLGKLQAGGLLLQVALAARCHCLLTGRLHLVPARVQLCGFCIANADAR
jgi:hypothetical protein